MINYKIILLTSAALALTGCSAMNGDYECPLKNGASCVSLQDMDRSLNEQINDPVIKKSSFNVVHKDLLPGSSPQRTSDLTAKIWFAPYEDGDGNYHDANYIYTVIEGTTWHGAPVKVS